MGVVITIPAYNEEEHIVKVIHEIKEVMDSSGYDYQILVVDDGSTDKTAESARKAGAVVISHPVNYGLAEAFKTEMKNCLEMNADIIVHTDADGQYPAEYIPKLVDKVKRGYGLVLGSRFGKGKYSGSIMNKLGNIAFAKVFSRLLKTKITDTTTGFRAFTAEVAKLPIVNKFTYTQEQLIRASKSKVKIGEISIHAKKTRKSRLFRNPLDYAVKAWVNILRIYRDYEPLKFFGSIGSFLFLLGFAVGLYFVYLHFTSGISGHLGLLFLMLILIFTGIQVILFGFLADMRK